MFLSIEQGFTSLKTEAQGNQEFKVSKPRSVPFSLSTSTETEVTRALDQLALYIKFQENQDYIVASIFCLFLFIFFKEKRNSRTFLPTSKFKGKPWLHEAVSKYIYAHIHTYIYVCRCMHAYLQVNRL